MLTLASPSHWDSWKCGRKQRYTSMKGVKVCPNDEIIGGVEVNTDAESVRKAKHEELSQKSLAVL